jgi:cytoskeletal protein CcmA (bactofilin family)
MFGRRAPEPPVREGLVVGPSDRVQGTVTAEAVTVAGEFEGTLSVVQSLTVVAGGRLVGTFDATRLHIAAGASVRATCRVGIPATEEIPLFAAPEAVVIEPAVRREVRVRTRDEESSGGTGLGW